SFQPDPAVHLVDDRAARHVARAIRHHRKQPGAGFPAILVARVRSDPLGLGYIRRHHRLVHVPLLPVHSPAAHDLDFRSAHPVARGPRRGGSTSLTQTPHGLMAEFDSPTALVNAARAAREKGYRRLDAYSPFPIEELTDALHLHHNKLPLIVLIGGIAGGTLGYLLQYYVTVIYFPINIGGRPLHSWPAYIVITFEMTILLASIACVLGLL